jgi:hypothetical protein
VLYGCETWSLTSRKERLRDTEKRVEEDGLCRKLHNDELHGLYSSPRVIKSRRIRWAGHVVHMGEGRGGEGRGVCKVLVGRPEGKR